MTTSIAAVLGGERILGGRARTLADWHGLISRGVPAKSADAFKEAAMISDRVLAGILGISEKTLARARTGKSMLDPMASDRLYRTAKILTLAMAVFEGGEPAVAWLKRPQIGLANQTPLALLPTTAGAEAVEQLLLRIEHGVYS